MTRFKRFIIATLIFTMLLSIFNIGVYASMADEETANPYATTLPCPNCSTMSRATDKLTELYSNVENGLPKCPIPAMAHTHVYYHFESYVNCSNCGRVYIKDCIRVYCMDVVVKEIAY